MVSVKQKQYKDDYCLVKQNSSFELSECPRVPLRGIEFPLYCFGSLPAKGNDDSYGGTSCTVEEEQSLLDCLLLSQWEDRSWKGLLKYDVTNCETKFISGSLMFIAQLSKGWRSSCFTECVENKILLAFDPFKFNCMKTLGEELLFCVASGENASSELITSSRVPNDGNLIILNVTPVEYGHIFMIPSDFYYLPQFLDARSLEMAAQVAIEINNSSFRVFYDYHASSRVNHLYFQACYYANPLPVEHVPVVPVTGNWQKSGIQICVVSDYPIKALLFKTKENFKILVTMVSEICCSLQHQIIAFSLLISECSMKMFLFPQVHTTSASVCNLSAWECGGHFVYRSRHDFDRANEETVVERLAAISLQSKGFQAVKQLSCSIASKRAS